MPINTGNKKSKLYLGSSNVSKAYLGSTKIYSSGNVVTYYVDEGAVYREEVEEGESCLEPKTFTPAMEGYAFAGWSIIQGGSVLDNLIMRDEPITLYAVWVSVGVPHYFTPFTSVTWSKDGDDWSIAAGENSMVVDTDFLKIRCRKQTNTNSFGHVQASAIIPTNGCTKVRVSVSISAYDEYGDGQSIMASVSINENSLSIHSSGNYELDVSGDYADFSMTIFEGTAYYWAEMTLLSIYFYD